MVIPHQAVASGSPQINHGLENGFEIAGNQDSLAATVDDDDGLGAILVGITQCRDRARSDGVSDSTHINHMEEPETALG